MGWRTARRSCLCCLHVIVLSINSCIFVQMPKCVCACHCICMCLCIFLHMQQNEGTPDARANVCQTSHVKEPLACTLKYFSRPITGFLRCVSGRVPMPACGKYLGMPHKWTAKCAARSLSLSESATRGGGALKSSGRKCHVNRDSLQ